VILLTRRLRLDPGHELKLIAPPLDKPGARFADRPANQLIRLALDSRKDLKAATGLADAADENVTNARGGYYPRLDFGGTGGTVSRTLLTHVVNGQDVLAGVSQQPELPQLEDHWLYTLGLTMTWAVFDRGVVHSQVEHAAADAKSAALDRDDLRIQVEGEVRQACGDYHAATRRLQAAEEGLKAAKAAYESVDGRYSVGAASFIDLTTAQTQLAEAEESQAQAKTDVFLQAKLIDHYVGVDKH
jgi:outer membrane protein